MAGSRLAQQARHELGLGLRQAGRRLVEQQHARPPGQRQGDLQLALLAVREVAHGGAGAVGQAHGGKGFCRARLQIGEALQRPEHRELRPGQRLGGQQRVLAHGQGGEEVGDLKRAGQAQRGAAVLGLGRHVGAEEGDAPRGHRQRAGDQVEQRGLARAVGTDERAPLARPHGELHAVDRAKPAERLADRLQLERERLARRHATGSACTADSRACRAAA